MEMEKENEKRVCQRCNEDMSTQSTSSTCQCAKANAHAAEEDATNLEKSDESDE